MPYDLFGDTPEQRPIERLFFGFRLPEPQADAATKVLDQSAPSTA